MSVRSLLDEKYALPHEERKDSKTDSVLGRFTPTGPTVPTVSDQKRKTIKLNRIYGNTQVKTSKVKTKIRMVLLKLRHPIKRVEHSNPPELYWLSYAFPDRCSICVHSG